jgi:hypothetical protein
MAGRSRSTKKLAQRIDLNYFKRLYPIPRWRRFLSLGLIVVGIAWLGWTGLRAYNAGPLARSHAILARNCASCHSMTAAFGKKVTDQACLSCHDGPVHHVEQAFTPHCADCHVEHQGAFRLADTRDEACTQCHSNLRNQPRVTSFESAHPEFAALRTPDPGTVKFGHEIHLKKNLRGPHGVVQLQCADCHTRADTTIAPIDYQKHCAACHPLLFDKRFSDPAPHKKPQIVIDYVTDQFAKYIAAHPEEVRLADPADPRILRPPVPPARDAAEWIAFRVADSEQLLWRKSCRECHTMTFAGTIPEVPPAAIRARWFSHSEFEHSAHQMLVCGECHVNAATSANTADVLVPGIATCRSCHRSGGAESRCFECHVYHDWSKEKPIDGRFTIKSF